MKRIPKATYTEEEIRVRSADRRSDVQASRRREQRLNYTL
jgi:hypothetical protein